MATDLLQLGGITFDAYATPDILQWRATGDEFRNGLQGTIALDKAARDYLLDSVLAWIGHSR
jgi:hypothetical protein